MAGSVGSIYAEAELNVDRFMSAVGEMDGGCSRITGALAGFAAEMEGAQECIDGVGGAMAAAGAQAVADYANAIQEGSGAAVGAAQSMASASAAAAMRAAESGMSGASSIGRNFSYGLASGISSGRSAVIAAAVNVASAAAAAARSALAIHSPSKVTEELGEYFDLGFIRGVEGMTPDIQDAIRSAVYVEPPAGAAYGAAKEVAPVVRVNGPAIDYDALAKAMDRRQVALYMNDKRVAQVMNRESARAQGVRNRSVALGYGK